MYKKSFRVLALLLTLMLLTLEAPAALGATAVKLNKKTAVIDLNEGSTLTLTTNASESIKNGLTWRSKNTAIATVSGGVVTAKKTGTVQIGVRYKNGPWAVCKVTVRDSRAPKSIVLSAAQAQLSVGETFELKATISPSNAAQSVKWQSSKPAVATVSPDGVITARKPGTASIRATSTRNTALKKTMKVTVKATAAPTSVSITPAVSEMEVGDKQALAVTVSPAGAASRVKWTSSNTTVATVSDSGVVTAKRAGNVTITATSTVKSTVKATRTIVVSDPNAVQSISIDQTDMYLQVDKSAQLTATLKPSGSNAKVTWSSSDSTIVSVSADGKVLGRKAGVATITAKSGTKSDNIEIRVLSDERVTVLPERYVASSSAITANHNKITAVFQSAIEELEANMASKAITARERANRKEILQRGFLMYDVPWSSDRTVRYWSGSTSYIADRIYFGMPYTQTNRTYNLDKWLKTVSVTKSGALNKIKGMPDTTYPGNDCSSFVSMAQWGYNSADSFLNSTALYNSTRYTTITDGFSKLIPGDVLVKNGHVAMFLYYVNTDRIMVLEQGGSSEPNTVTVNIKSISGIYKAQGYRVRRKVGIGS